MRDNLSFFQLGKTPIECRFIIFPIGENNNRETIHHFSNWGKHQSRDNLSFFQWGKTTIECRFIIFPIGENDNRVPIHHFPNPGIYQPIDDSFCLVLNQLGRFIVKSIDFLFEPYHIIRKFHISFSISFLDLLVRLFLGKTLLKNDTGINVSDKSHASMYIPF